MSEKLYLGLKAQVLAIEKKTGRIVWRTELSGSWLADSFVSVHCDGSSIFAYTKRVLYSLAPEDGRIRWQTSLKEFGAGLPTFGTSDPSAANLMAMIRKMQQDQEAAAAVAASSATAAGG